MSSSHHWRRTNYTVLVAGLFVMSLLMGLMIWITANAYFQADTPPTKKMLLYLTWVGAATLGISLLLLAWTTTRWMKHRVIAPPEQSTAPLGPSAWDEAGRRLQVPDAEEFQDDQEELDY